MAGRPRSKGRPLAPRRSERFETNAISCSIGQVRDVSREGFRLSTAKKPGLKVGEVHEIVLRAGGKQVRVASRVQWIRRVGLWPASYQLGFAIVDSRPGVGVAVLQFGQFGCADGGQAPGTGSAPQPSAKAPCERRPAPKASATPSSATEASNPETVSSWSSAEPSHAAQAVPSEPGDQVPPTYDIPEEDEPVFDGDGGPEAGAELDDLYALLEVAPDSDTDAIKSAYRRLAREWHPDHNKNDDAAQTFARIASAYAVLRDPTRRKWYDEIRSENTAA